VSILFFTCANGPYEDFGPLYAFSVLAHVDNASVEIGVENVDSFFSQHGPAIELVRRTFGEEKLKIRAVPWVLANGRKILPNSVRFINEPEMRAEYVYIGDIDIILLDRKFMASHLKDMDATGLPYSNSVRPATTRMSGLHFAVMDAHYPLPKLDDLDLRTLNDEIVLYEIVKRKGMPIIPDRWYRPTHGIHISPNRPVEKTKTEEGQVVPGWSVEPYKSQWAMLNAENAFQQLRTMLSPRVRECLLSIDEVAQKHSRQTSAGR
jgi:hypothetical protein